MATQSPEQTHRNFTALLMATRLARHSAKLGSRDLDVFFAIVLALKVEADITETQWGILQTIYQNELNTAARWEQLRAEYGLSSREEEA